MCDPQGDQLVYIVYILLAILGSVVLIELAFVLYQLSKLLDIIAKYYINVNTAFPSMIQHLCKQQSNMRS